MKVRGLNGRFEFARMTKFGVAAMLGFLVAEGIIIVGLYAFYGRPDVPSASSTSPTLILLDVFALGTGVAVGFFLNERTTVRDLPGKKRGAASAALRLGRFEAVSALGNAVVIMVQLALLGEFALSPAIGNAFGGVVSFPLTYLISMRFVWRA